MALIDKETIRAEIDKRYAEYRAKMKTDDFTYYEGMADALDLFEQFLDTFPEQTVTDCHNALTWEDIRTICLLTIGAEVVHDNPDLADNVQEKLEQVFYEDVLRRFREMKDK